ASSSMISARARWSAASAWKTCDEPPYRARHRGRCRLRRGDCMVRREAGFQASRGRARGGGKRWVVMAPREAAETRLLLARADGAAQEAAIGNQTGGRVFLFIDTDDFARDHARMLEHGVRFVEAPRREPYGIVAVIE